MAIEKLRTDFQDDIINTEISDRRRYNLIENSDGTVSLEDMTTYFQIGSTYGAKQINKTNEAVNELIDKSETAASNIEDLLEKTSNINNTPDAEKRVAYADESGSVANDFILANQRNLVFTNRVCRITNEKITADSLADVYFTADTLVQAQRAVISVETYDGYVELTAETAPTSTVKASIRIRVV